MTFAKFVKHPAVSKTEKMNLLHDYRDYLLQGKGKQYATHAPLLKEIKQSGGSYNGKGGSFLSWLKGAASTIYNKVIVPAVDYVKKKQLTAISKAAGAFSLIPTPLSGVLRGVATAAGAAGNAFGAGMKHRHHHRVGMMT